MGARPTSFARTIPDALMPPIYDHIPEEDVAPARVWSEEQNRIFDWFSNLDGVEGNLVVTARAGAAKTTTAVEGINRAPESSILMCAFNKRIAEELNRRIQNPCAEAKTLHALGYGMIRRHWKGMGVSNGSERADSLTDGAVKSWEDANHQKVPKQIHRLITQLHTKGREMTPLDGTMSVLEDLCIRFNLEPDENWGQFNTQFVVLGAQRAMYLAATVEPTRKIGIDYADMMFLPLAWNLTSQDYQLVVVDEAQDMTVAQLELARRCCSGRMCIIGDDRQAIYGFRGADTESLSRLREELDAAELSLTTTYRCGKKIVQHAQRLVPSINAHESNGDGTIEDVSYQTLTTDAMPGDFVLSRLNAPLVSIVLRFWSEGRRAKMAGRDLGAGILSILKKLRCQPTTPMEDVMEKVRAWESKTCTKLAATGHGDLVERTRDQAAMIYAFAEFVDTMGELESKCQYLFSDEDSDGGQVLCSSVHKAKGLEADRVWVLTESLYRRGWTQEEENIEYVAVTRAKHHLCLVTEVPSLQTKPSGTGYAAKSGNAS